MLNQNEVPTTETLKQVVLYLAAVIVLGISFSFTLGLMNTEFEMGVLGTLANVYFTLRLGRYIAIKHFTETTES